MGMPSPLGPDSVAKRCLPVLYVRIKMFFYFQIAPANKEGLQGPRRGMLRYIAKIIKTILCAR